MKLFILLAIAVFGTNCQIIKIPQVIVKSTTTTTAATTAAGNTTSTAVNDLTRSE